VITCCITFTEGPNGIVSPFHDVPLFASMVHNTVNMVVEIPRWTNAKMEVHKRFAGASSHYVSFDFLSINSHSDLLH